MKTLSKVVEFSKLQGDSNYVVEHFETNDFLNPSGPEPARLFGTGKEVLDFLQTIWKKESNESILEYLCSLSEAIYDGDDFVNIYEIS